MCPVESAAQILLRKSATSRESRMAQQYRGVVFAFDHPYNPPKLETENLRESFPLRLSDPGVQAILEQHMIATKNCEMCDSPFSDNGPPGTESNMCVDHFHCEVTKKAMKTYNKKDKSVRAG